MIKIFFEPVSIWKYQFVFVVFVVLSGCETHPADETQHIKVQSASPDFMPMLQTESGKNFASALKSEFDNWKLEWPLQHENQSVEMAYRWNRFCDALNQESNEQEMLHAFLVACEDVAGQRPPDWWVDRLKKSQERRSGIFSFPDDSDAKSEIKIEWPTNSNSHTVVRVGQNRFEFPSELELLGEAIAIVENDTSVFVGAYSFNAYPFEAIKVSGAKLAIWVGILDSSGVG